MRLIDADAFEVFFLNVPEDVHPESYVRGVQSVLEAIDASPTVQTSAQPEQRWIPVAERLPKKYGDYLVTTHSGQIARYIFIGKSSEEYWRRCATAWMPLPEPYAERRTDDLQ